MVNRLIVWTTNNRYDKPEKHIYGIYRDINDVVETCTTYEVSNDGTLCDSESVSDDIICTRINILAETRVLYFVNIHEIVSVRNDNMSIVVFEDKTEAIDYAIIHFKDEHNRSDDCDDCPACLNNFIKSLEDNGFGDIECDDYEGIGVSFWSMTVN